MWTGILWAAAVCAGLGFAGSVVLVLACLLYTSYIQYSIPCRESARCARRPGGEILSSVHTA